MELALKKTMPNESNSLNNLKIVFVPEFNI
jgi:hypothetical protein